MKNILIIFTGGTISMKRDKNINASVPSMCGKDILDLIPNVDNIANIHCMDFSTIPSPHITPEKMLELSKMISENAKVYDGIVVTHGTDSLEETAYLVDLTCNTSNPVIFTGAMKSSSELGWDGAANLVTAVLTAASESAKNKGVLVIMNGEIHCAAQVTKTNTHSLDTFKSLDFGPIGFVDNNKPYFYFDYSKSEYISVSKIESGVSLIKCACGMDYKLIKFCVDSGTKGIVIEGMGSGNIPPDMLPGIDYAINRNIPIILVSRCITGKVSDSYGYKGGGKDLTNRGVILGGNLNGQKARIKLMAALGFTNDLCEIKKIFKQNYYK
ncbi:asparaginase [Clostridium pasteurianum]|uniref:asparaginase n=1 Tax=Clostridium pasteurianum TaxID=1501 RepID=UPI002260AD91|nr:asparaginase [Clostridium pasteurianum]UZW12786.1 asparaginase [Clostridium pasteurianum]